MEEESGVVLLPRHVDLRSTKVNQAFSTKAIFSVKSTRYLSSNRFLQSRGHTFSPLRSVLKHSVVSPT